ncbi:uncharacterized protein LOC130900381 [Diorhabda carinulata]|uniref:uncharacterized protein LOC130900381 n=1 Tax=Diorhabda carinulata TaxID=1163345 RepID=UPI0025A0030F|nr:uncharacterized protein LOC130900381 [Diorhabda carinulata]
MKKYPYKNAILDKLHRGFVYSCIGLTLYAGTYIAVHYFNYFTQIKPEKDHKSLLENQQLLAEGAPDTATSLIA